jgi:transcriptional regulator with XRE-family HTH domain
LGKALIKLTKTGIGQRLRLARQSRGLTQAQLAKKLGTIQSNISDLERGARKPTLQQLVNLGRILDMSIDKILLDAEHQGGNGAIGDRRFIGRLHKIDKLSARDKQALLKNVDMFLKGAGVT